MAQKFLTNFTPPGTSDLYKFRAGALFYGTTSNSTTAMTVSIPGVTEYYTGLTLILKMGAQAASGCTLNVNSLGAKAMKYGANSVGTYFTSGATYLFVYDGTDFKAIHSYNSNTTYSNMTGATTSAAGKAGLVPAPAAGEEDEFLRGDGTWATPTNTNTKMRVYRQTSGYDGNYPLLVSRSLASDIGTAGTNASNTTVYGVFRENTDGNAMLLANPAKGTITAPGGFIGNASTATNVAWTGVTGKPSYYDAKAIKSITRSGTTFTYTCLDGTTGTFTQQDNNTTYTFTNKAATLAWGTKSTIATVGGVDITITMPANPNTNTHYVTGITAGATGTTSNSATTNGNTFIKIKDDSTHRGQVKIVGSGATTVTSDANGVITINSTDNNTVYTHPTSSGNKHIPSGGSSGQILRWSADGTAAWGADNNTNYYHTRVYSSGLKISTGTGVSDMYVPSATGSQSGVVMMHPAANCTTFTSDDSTCTVAAVKKAVTLFTNDYAPTKTGGGASGTWGISITGSAGSVAWSNVTGKPSSFPPESHTHNYAGSSSAGGAASTVTVTETTPSSATTYYLHYSTGVSGSQTTRANADLYYYDTGTSSYFNVGSSSNIGGLTLHYNNGKYVNLITDAVTANRDIKLPDASGTIALTGHTHNYAPSSHSHSGTYKKAANTTAAVKPEGTNSSTSITPAGTVSQPTFTGTAHTHTFTPTTTTVYSVSSVGTMFAASVSDEVLILTPGTAPTRSGVTVATGGSNSSVTATGTVSQPTFTGTAASHTHTFTGTNHSHGITISDTTITVS